MLVQLQINNTQSEFFINLISNLENVIEDVVYIEQNETEDKSLMKYQEENGFSKNVLAQESEDVWNDL